MNEQIETLKIKTLARGIYLCEYCNKQHKSYQNAVKCCEKARMRAKCPECGSKKLDSSFKNPMDLKANVRCDVCKAIYLPGAKKSYYKVEDED